MHAPCLGALLFVVIAVQPCGLVAHKLTDDVAWLSLLQRRTWTSRHGLGKASAKRHSEALVHSKNELGRAHEALSALAAFARAKAGSNASAPEVDRFLTNDDPEAIEYLNCHSRLFVDLCTIGLLIALVSITGAGCCLGKTYVAPAMVAASYIIWIPGLFAKDFSFSVGCLVRQYAATLPIVQSLGFVGKTIVAQLPVRIMATEVDDQETPGPIRESTRSLVGWLWRKGLYRGAVLIALFAFVVPILKLLLLVLVGLWRKHSDPVRVRMSRYMLIIVQMVSKWASPDMFAFMLLYYLIRTLSNPPLIETLEVFDIGFVCYNLFCVCSVVSSLLIELPEVPLDAQEQLQETCKVQAARELLQAWGGRTAVIVVTIVNAVAWAALFFPGLHRPVLTLRLDARTILEENNFSQSSLDLLESFVDFDSIADMVSANVSLWKATCAFWRWFLRDYELTILLALFMLMVFCIVFTIIDMVLLVIVACIAGSSGIGQESRATQLMKAVSVIKHLSMVDVCMTGVFVVTFAAENYSEMGFLINNAFGAWELLGTEVIHYMTYNIVSWSVKALEREDVVGEKSPTKSPEIEDS